jgi:hypothetical protein
MVAPQPADEGAVGAHRHQQHDRQDTCSKHRTLGFPYRQEPGQSCRREIVGRGEAEPSFESTWTRRILLRKPEFPHSRTKPQGRLAARLALW